MKLLNSLKNIGSTRLTKDRAQPWSRVVSRRQTVRTMLIAVSCCGFPLGATNSPVLARSKGKINFTDHKLSNTDAAFVSVGREICQLRSEPEQAALLDKNGKQLSELSNLNPVRAYKLYQQIVAEDFREDRVILLDGWLMAEFEAAFCLACYNNGISK